MKVKVTRSCLTLCNPMDHTVHGIFQARILEWEAIPFSRNLLSPGVEPGSPALQVDSLPDELPGKPIYLHRQRENQNILSGLQLAIDDRISTTIAKQDRPLFYFTSQNTGGRLFSIFFALYSILRLKEGTRETTTTDTGDKVFHSFCSAISLWF